MRTYDNLVEALNDLRARGYKNDFDIEPRCIKCSSLNIQLQPEDFSIVETYRFEGNSTPDDNSILYAIESKDGVKGVMVDAYGPYADSLTPEMAKKLGNSGDTFSSARPIE